MGPRPFRRGNSLKGCGIGLLRRRFNGATSFQTWKSGNTYLAHAVGAGLQWGHVLSDVEMRFEKEKLPYVVGLQWGHVLSDVEISLSKTILPSRSMASMGPRPFRRGNFVNRGPALYGSPGFNGATSFQTWKSLIREIPRYFYLNRFNGATSFQTWK